MNYEYSEAQQTHVLFQKLMYDLRRRPVSVFETKVIEARLAREDMDGVARVLERHDEDESKDDWWSLEHEITMESGLGSGRAKVAAGILFESGIAGRLLARLLAGRPPAELRATKVDVEHASLSDADWAIIPPRDPDSEA